MDVISIIWIGKSFILYLQDKRRIFVHKNENNAK